MSHTKERVIKIHQTCTYTLDVTLDELSDMALRNVYNVFGEIHKTHDMFSVPPNTPLDRILSIAV